MDREEAIAERESLLRRLAAVERFIEETRPGPHKECAALLMELFSSDELRRFLRYRVEGVAERLPSSDVSLARLASGAVLELRGFTREALRAELVAARPRQQRLINAMTTQWEES